MGLSGMRARARSAGGELSFRSRPGKGLTIDVWAARSSAEKGPAAENHARDTEDRHVEA
jgi:hypothetical protein